MRTIRTASTVAVTLVLMAAVPAVAAQDNGAVVSQPADPRPAAPPEPDLIAAQQFDCATATLDPPPLIMREVRRVQEQTRHSLQLSRWYASHFIAAGVWTQAEATAFAANIAQRPELAENQRWSARVVPLLQQDMAEMAGHMERRDYPAACRAVLVMLGRASEMSTLYRRLWATIDASYTAEATRLNVTLPQSN